MLTYTILKFSFAFGHIHKTVFTNSLELLKSFNWQFMVILLGFTPIHMINSVIAIISINDCLQIVEKRVWILFQAIYSTQILECFFHNVCTSSVSKVLHVPFIDSILFETSFNMLLIGLTIFTFLECDIYVKHYIDPCWRLVDRNWNQFSLTKILIQLLVWSNVSKMDRHASLVINVRVILSAINYAVIYRSPACTKVLKFSVIREFV